MRRCDGDTKSGTMEPTVRRGRSVTYDFAAGSSRNDETTDLSGLLFGPALLYCQSIASTSKLKVSAGLRASVRDTQDTREATAKRYVMIDATFAIGLPNDEIAIPSVLDFVAPLSVSWGWAVVPRHAALLLAGDILVLCTRLGQRMPPDVTACLQERPLLTTPVIQEST